MLEMLATGKSAREVGSELGVSRDAVIGKVDRIRNGGRSRPRKKLCPLGAVKVDLKPGSLIKPKKLRCNNVARAAERIVKNRALVCEEVVDLPDTACTIVELYENCCHWPLGDPALDSFRYCGAPKPVGMDRPYCATHAALAYTPRVRAVGSTYHERRFGY